MEVGLLTSEGRGVPCRRRREGIVLWVKGDRRLGCGVVESCMPGRLGTRMSMTRAVLVVVGCRVSGVILLRS